MSKNKKTNIKLKDWVNTPNNDGLTSVHFAAYRGNNDLIDYLVSLGADVYAIDNDGHNCIHVAAQSNRVNTIYFLLKKYGFNINQGDNKKSTALHWAAFLSRENALTFLLAWGADPNLQDIDNNTPLHLSVILSWKGETLRNVKLLLLKGASRTIVNNDLSTPLDLVNSGDYFEKELRGLLKESNVISWFMLKTPLKKMNKNEKTVVFFIILVCILVFLSFSYIIPTFNSNFITIFSGLSAILMLLAFAIATLKEPGYLEKDPSVDFQELLNTLNPVDICPECEIILTPRWRHWNICNKWVERFDHHCPYINNWVGYNNHSYFLFYIGSLAFNLLLQLVLTSIALAKQDNVGKSLCEEMSSPILFYVSCVIILIITGLFILPVLFLTFIHFTNFMKNKTTNERFSKQKINHTSLTARISNSAPDDNNPSFLTNTEYHSFMGTERRNWFSNCASMCDYRPPSQMEMRNEILRQD